MDINPDLLREILRAELEAGVHIDETELRRVVQSAVTETLTSLGLQPEDPKAMQRDMQFLRELRETAEAVRRKGILVLVGALIAAGLAALLAGIKALLG